MALRIDLRHVDAFLALARTLHFGRAARALSVSQPALSRTINTLEETIGVPLFVRTTRQVDLTEAGRAFVQSAPSILEALEKSVADARRAAAGETGRLNSGLHGLCDQRTVAKSVAAVSQRSTWNRHGSFLHAD
jgi:DNA-binding transcriptional LysR family regulator